MYRIKTRITAYILSFIIVSTGVFSAFSIPAGATVIYKDLYGTGSADEINIIKLLDLALNRGGMVMSPATIKAFLEFWWGSVKSDLTSIVNNVDSSITTTQEFINYVNSALVNADHYDKLGTIMKRYIQYCTTMEFKTLSELKHLITQEGTFRKFLLSYVTDENGNIVGTVGKFPTKYKTNSELVNMVRKAADTYVEEYEGYYLVKTHKPGEFLPSFFDTKKQYNLVHAILNTITDNMVIGVSFDEYWTTDYFFRDFTDYSFVKNNYNASGILFFCDSYDDNWSVSNPNSHLLSFKNEDSNGNYLEDGTITGDGFNLSAISESDYKLNGAIYIMDENSFKSKRGYAYSWLCTKDGRYVKVWKSVDAMKGYMVGKSNIYYSNTYSSFDNSVDNSITFTGQYFNTSEYSHTTIQNNIDNSQETINETTVNNIVNNYITNNYYGTDVPAPSPGPDTDSSLTEIITGISQLPTVLIDGLEKLFTKLFVPSEGFADPIKDKINAKFYFISDTHSDIVGLADRFDSMGQTAPTITFPLSKTPLGSYGVGDITISFEWFEPYRTGFQLLISAIMWAMFLFSQYFGIKNLIQATDSAAGRAF